MENEKYGFNSYATVINEGTENTFGLASESDLKRLTP